MAETLQIDPYRGMHEPTAAMLHGALSQLWRAGKRTPFGIKHQAENRMLLTEPLDHRFLGHHQLLVMRPAETVGHPRHVLGFFALEETDTPLRILDVRPGEAREPSLSGAPRVSHSDLIFLASATRDAWVDRTTPVEAVHRMGARMLAAMATTPPALTVAIPGQRQATPNIAYLAAAS